MYFHEHKLWQEAYVALMDIHEALEDEDESQSEGRNSELIDELLESAQQVAAMVADSLTRQDRRTAKELLTNCVGQIAKTRTHLAVCWGRGIFDDETFRRLDGKYDALSSSLQSFR